MALQGLQQIANGISAFRGKKDTGSSVQAQAQELLTAKLGAADENNLITEEQFTDLFDHLKSWMHKAEGEGVSAQERKQVISEVYKQLDKNYFQTHQAAGVSYHFEKNLTNLNSALEIFLQDQINEKQAIYGSMTGADLLSINSITGKNRIAVATTLKDGISDLCVSDKNCNLSREEQMELLDNILKEVKQNIHEEASEEQSSKIINKALSKRIKENSANLSQSVVKDLVKSMAKDGAVADTSSMMMTIPKSKQEAVLVGITRLDKEASVAKIQDYETEYKQSIQGMSKQEIRDIQTQANKQVAYLASIDGENSEEIQSKVKSSLQEFELKDKNGNVNQKKTQAAKAYLKLSSAKTLENADKKNKTEQAGDYGELINYLLGGAAVLFMVKAMCFKTKSSKMKGIVGDSVANSGGGMMKGLMGIGVAGALAHQTGILGGNGSNLLDEFANKVVDSDLTKKVAAPAMRV